MTTNNGFHAMLQQIKRNPAQLLAKKYRLPMSLSSNPQEIVQQLLNSGQVRQDEVNHAVQTYKQGIRA